METTDEALRDQLPTGQMNEEAPSELTPACNPKGVSKEDEDFLSGLNPEEKECLVYLLQIINTLDEDINDADEHHERMAESLGSEDQSESNVVDSSTQRSTSVEVATTKPNLCPATPKDKIINSRSEESRDTIQRSKLDPCGPQATGPPRLTGSHPAYFRKFDTIMRSGVNVQELRSRFLLRCDSSAAIREPREGGAATIKQRGPFVGGQKSPRDEALQKLGFRQRQSSLPNINSCLLPVAGQYVQSSLTESLNHDATANSINSTEEA